MLRTAFLALTFLVAAHAAAPVPVIFDTDMGNDIDDALALAMLHALESRGECRLLGVTLTNPAPNAGPYTSLVNRFYGRPDIPIGISREVRKEGADHKYLDAGVNAAPAHLRKTNEKFEDAVPLLRRLLAQSKEKVVLVQVGFSENLAALMDTKGDAHSPLDGMALIRAKVSLLSIMAGDFATNKPEYNVRVNVPVAKRILETWPTPTVVSGFEIGKELLFPATSIENDFRATPWNPVVESYRAYQKMPYDRPTWDLTSVLAAVRPDAKYFDLSPRGGVVVDEKGATTFRAGAGDRQYLILPADRRDRVLEALVLLSTQPPAAAAAVRQ